MKDRTPTLLVFCICWCTQFALGQINQYAIIYLPLEFSVSEVTEKGYNQVSIWMGQYQKSKGDQSGELWSKELLPSHQYKQAVLEDDRLVSMTSYFQNGAKNQGYELYYKQGLLSVIDRVYYDSLEEKQLDYSMAYFYNRKGQAIQRVRQYPEYRNLRKLTEFNYDSEKRLVKILESSQGFAPKMDSLIGMGRKGKYLKIIRYETNRVLSLSYLDMYQLQKEDAAQLDEERRFSRREIKNELGVLQYEVQYIYKEDKLLKEEYTNKEKSSEFNINTEGVFKQIYYKYNEEGFLETKIIEEKDVQTVYDYSYLNK